MNKNESVKILIADDHQLVIDGIKSLLADRPEIEVVGEALNGVELLKVLKNTLPDIILMDINMPNMDGIQTMKKLKDLEEKAKVLILSTHDDVRLVREILRLGAKGYVLKSASQDELICAILTIAKGEQYFSKEISDKIMRWVAQDEQKSGESKEAMLPVSLTKREKEILRYIAMEFSGPQIAKELHISINTVETHRKNLLRKTKAKSTVGLVKYAMKHDLI
ncbi:MAG: response regulator transcription factor [Bacteroidota bacterium]